MPYVETIVLATFINVYLYSPLSTFFNRHLTKLDELNDLFYGHATQEDGIVLSQVKKQ